MNATPDALAQPAHSHPTQSGQVPAGQTSPLAAVIDELWDQRAELTPADADAATQVLGAVDMLDSGQARVAWVTETGDVAVDERAKRAILLAFRLLPMVKSQVGDFRYHDRVPLTARLDGVRVVAGSIVRWGAYVAPGAVLMPSFVNIGAYVDTGTMVDTWATVGSCAQIGKNVHLAGGVGIGGVLSRPTPCPSWSRTTRSSAPAAWWWREPGSAPAPSSGRARS